MGRPAGRPGSADAFEWWFSSEHDFYFFDETLPLGYEAWYGVPSLPWDHPETWDTAVHDAHRALIALRRSSKALQQGGLRYVHVDSDLIVRSRSSTWAPGACMRRAAAT